jgi:hypothetical protein
MLTASTARAQGWLVIVTGIPGAPQYRASFDSVANAMATGARTRLGLPDEHIIRLAERTTPPATAVGIQSALAALATRAGARDVIAIVLIGHGSAMGGSPRFNIAGPDLTAEQLRASLAAFATQEVVVVNTASASGPWIEALAGPRRTIITATRSDTERDETVFGRYFAEGLGSDAGDADKDGRVSLLEAFEYARQGVERHYQASRHLRTEHALLDDDGDGHGSMAPSSGADGRRAATIFLDAPQAVPGDTATARLLARRDSLQRALADLQARRATTDSTAFAREMDTLLLEIARTGAAIRGRRP